MNLLYNLTRNKLNQNYINKLTQLLYDCKSTKNYSLKRINLDKAVYKFDKNNELYITLPNFNYKNKSITYDNNNINTINNKNCSIQNFTENGSNFLTNDTNYNISYINPNLPKKKDNKKKLTLTDIYGKREKEQLEKTIKALLLNEDLEMPKRAEKLIFNELNRKYKFEGSQNKKRYISQPKLFSKRYDINTEIKANKNPKLIFPQINSDNKFIDYLNIIKTKTSELNSIKQKKSKIYLSPLFFLGKNRDSYLNNINYNSYRKFSNDKNNKNYKNIREENHKYLKIMGKDIHNLNIINNENKFIIDSKTT